MTHSLELMTQNTFAIPPNTECLTNHGSSIYGYDSTTKIIWSLNQDPTIGCPGLHPGVCLHGKPERDRTAKQRK